MKKIYIYAIVLSLFLMAGSVLATASSDNYQIDGGQFTSGAGTVSSDNYETDVAFNPTAGSITSDNYNIEQGEVFNTGEIDIEDPGTGSVAGGGGVIESETVPPEIVSLEIINISKTKATIFFETNEIAVAFVEYGENNKFDINTGAEDSFLFSHDFLLEDLRPATLYKFRVHMFDRHHNVAVTEIYQFTTLPTVVIIPEVPEEVEIIPEEIEGVPGEVVEDDAIVEEEVVGEEVIEIPITLEPEEFWTEVEETFLTDEEIIKIFTFVKQESLDEEGKTEINFVPVKIENKENKWQALVGSETLLSLPAEIFKKDIAEIKAEVEGQVVVLKYNAESQAYESLVTMPTAGGEYDVKIQVRYDDDTYEELSKTIKVIQYGVVIEKKFFDWFLKEKKVIPFAKVSIYKEVGEGEWELWKAEEHNQYNPQVTDENGNFVFLVPEGKYYLEVTALGYKNYKSKVMEVIDEMVVPEIKLKVASKVIGWGWMISLGLAVFILLLYTLKRKK